MTLIRLDSPEKIKLDSIDTRERTPLTKEDAEKEMVTLSEELEDLQEALYAAGVNGALIVLQGRDTAGKDGTLKAVAGAMNPVGIRIASFKVPTPLELSHDFLWRIHSQTPGRGEIVYFNRSHYEDVLVVRVHNLAPEEVWKERFDHINDFEKVLSDSGIIILKFYLHISKEEQEQRLLDREKEPKKAWKLNPGDWKEREFWDDYTRAYEDVLEKCSTKYAPWYIIPSDQKWYRNLIVARAVVEALSPYKKEWQEKLDNIGKTQKAALEVMRQQEEKAKNARGK